MNQYSQSRAFCSLSVGPRSQERIVLGTFDSLDEVKGYYVELPPGTDPEALVTHTTSLPVDNKLKLILHATNYGNLPVAAEVRELS